MTAEPIADLAEEAHRLVAAAQDWLGSVLPADHIATGAPVCSGCPVCRLITTLRGDRPEAAEQLAAKVSEWIAVGATVLQALTATLANRPDAATEAE